MKTNTLNMTMESPKKVNIKFELTYIPQIVPVEKKMGKELKPKLWLCEALLIYLRAQRDVKEVEKKAVVQQIVKLN